MDTCEVALDLQADLAEMETDSVDPLHETLCTLRNHLLILSPSETISTRASVRCTFPVPSMYVLNYTESPVFQLNVDLPLFRCLLWYKGFTGYVKQYLVNSECLFLLNAVHLTDARSTGGLTVDDAYIQHISSLSLSSEKIALIRQRIKTSLYSQFTKSLETPELENVMNTLLNAIGNVPSSLTTYSQVPLQEGDIFSFYGNVYTDIPSVLPFSYRIDLCLTETLTSLYTITSSSPITDTLIMISRTPSEVSNIVRAYIPVNLSSVVYKSTVQSLYSPTIFATTIQEADRYTALYVSTGHYVYEMYAIYIWANIALYYHYAPNA